MKRILGTLSAALLASLATPALAQNAEVTTDLNMRAGPGTRYPVITTIPGGRDVTVYGCIQGYDWCDVRWRNTRGWVFADYLEYYYRQSWRPVPEWGARIDLPIITFSFGEYADRHYRDQPWWDDRDRWDRDRRDRRDWRDDDRRDRDDRRGDWRDDDDRRDRGDWRDDGDRRDDRRGDWRDDDDRGDDRGDRRDRGDDRGEDDRGDARRGDDRRDDRRGENDERRSDYGVDERRGMTGQRPWRQNQ